MLFLRVFNCSPKVTDPKWRQIFKVFINHLSIPSFVEKGRQIKKSRFLINNFEVQIFIEEANVINLLCSDIMVEHGFHAANI